MFSWRNKSKIIAYKFKGEAAAWWDQLQVSRRRQESNLWWYGDAWSNSYKVDSFQPIINRSFTINLSKAGMVRGLWRYTRRSFIALWCDLSLTEEKQTAKYIHRLNYPLRGTCSHAGRVLCQWSAKQDHEDRELTKQSFTFQMFFINGRAVGDDGVPPSSTMISQPIVQTPVNASTSTPTINPMIKSKTILTPSPGLASVKVW